MRNGTDGSVRADRRVTTAMNPPPRCRRIAGNLSQMLVRVHSALRMTPFLNLRRHSSALPATIGHTYPRT